MAPGPDKVSRIMKNKQTNSPVMNIYKYSFSRHFSPTVSSSSDHRVEGQELCSFADPFLRTAEPPLLSYITVISTDINKKCLYYTSLNTSFFNILIVFPSLGPKLFKEPSFKSNKFIIHNALSRCCLAGKVNESQKKKIVEVQQRPSVHHTDPTLPY